jgi:hypothetical protein
MIVNGWERKCGGRRVQCFLEIVVFLIINFLMFVWNQTFMPNVRERLRWRASFPCREVVRSFAIEKKKSVPNVHSSFFATIYRK